MYAIWDWDLYFINNCFWDTRPEKLYKIYDYGNNITPTKKKEFRRIYFDIIDNIDIYTIKYYTSKKWIILSDVTTYWNLLNNNKQIVPKMNEIENKTKNIISCDSVCDIVEKVLKYDGNDLFTDIKIEKVFWGFIINLCINSDFNRWFKIYYYSWSCWDTAFINKTAFKDFILLLYNNINNENNYHLKTKALVTLLYYLYIEYLKIKDIDFFLDELPSKTVSKIKQITENEVYFVGEHLIEIIKFNKQRNTKSNANAES